MQKLMMGLIGVSMSLTASAFDFGSLGDTLKDALGNKPDTATQTPAAQKTGVDSLKPAEMNSGLKEALTRGAEAAVAQLGQKDGFFGNADLKIPLPPSLQKTEQVLRMMGMGDQADELVLAMNRAAEAAVPEAKSLLINAVKQMTVQDARGILTGGDTAATEFFRGKTETTLTQRFGPKVKAVTDKVGLAQQYNTYAGSAAKFGLVQEDQATVEQYVTQRALDGLYKVIGEQERSLRANPLQAGSNLLQKVFGAVAK